MPAHSFGSFPESYLYGTVAAVFRFGQEWVLFYVHQGCVLRNVHIFVLVVIVASVIDCRADLGFIGSSRNTLCETPFCCRNFEPSTSFSF